MTANSPARAEPSGTSRERLHRVRGALVLAVDDLRTLLINGNDRQWPADTAVHEPLAGITELAEIYRAARHDPSAQSDGVADGQPRRRYVNPGDTILVVLSVTERCRRQQLSERRTRVHVTALDAELDLAVGPGQLRLGHADVGIHRDPDTDRLYILQPEGDQA